MKNLDLGKMFGDSNQEMQKAAVLKVPGQTGRYFPI